MQIGLRVLLTWFEILSRLKIKLEKSELIIGFNANELAFELSCMMRELMWVYPWVLSLDECWNGIRWKSDSIEGLMWKRQYIRNGGGLL